ncbi:receptor-like protein EIX1 isoform X2 [Quercus suber]|uniref:receptor-like protein EIX1 isoform X2 n=1 Tax=Quercus suber TaxID=58331 RepID=UPI0032DF3B97
MGMDRHHVNGWIEKEKKGTSPSICGFQGPWVGLCRSGVDCLDLMGSTRSAYSRSRRVALEDQACASPFTSRFSGNILTLAAKSMRGKLFSRLNKTLLMTIAFFLLGAPIKIVAHGVGSGVATKQATSLSSTSLSHPAFPQGFCELGNLSNLQYLDLSGNNFNKPENLEWLPQLSSLEYLDMSTVNLSKVNNWLHVVNKLPYLTSLHLYSLLEWLFNSNTSVVDLDLRFNEFQGSIPDDFTRINSLAHLYLDSNEFEGEIPKAFGGMCNLKTLSLSWNYLNGQLDFIQNLTECANHSLEVLRLDGNQIMGSLPDDLTTFLSLGELSLFRNHLNGTIPVSLGKLSNLEFLYLGDNPLKGVISEAHFSNLTQLKYLDLSNTKLVFNFSSDWSPPFQLDTIMMKSCQLGPRFPKWLQTQKNFHRLDISNSSISDTLSNSNWIFSSQVLLMNLSHNQLSGHVPNLLRDFSLFPILDLSSNKLEGEIPRFLFKAVDLDLSKKYVFKASPIPMYSH